MSTDSHVSVAEAALILDKSRRTVQRYVQTGKLPAGRIGGTWLIARADLAGGVA